MKGTRQLELLAPAKNLECGKAAIDHGADAVYIGPPAFGARAAAGNSVADIAELCRYAHQYGAKVYATVNTLLHDDELPQAVSLLQQLADARVDAVLIQDMRLSPSMLHLTPTLFFHASTQADNRTPEKVKLLWEQGFSRAVLARELSVDEIAAIHHAVPQMELEVFVHGALCVSYSGLCYASEHCFNRSANRGECAQFCRMPFDLLDANGNELEHQRHLLSLRDLNLSAHLGELIEAGAVSFKIEGRLKDVTYVKNVTAAYSQLLNQYISAHPGQYERAARGVCHYTFQPDLQRTFNRGYTTYFLHGRQPHIASFFTPKAIGQQVGTVKELRGTSFTVAGTASFANGDGLCFFDARHELVGFRINRAEGNRLFPLQLPPSLRPGMVLYRSNDQQMEQLLQKPSAQRRIPVTMALRATNDGFALRIGQVETSLPMVHQQAQKPQHDRMVSELTKLGGTPFECTQMDIPTDFPFFIPASQLAALRRKAVEKALAEENKTKQVALLDKALPHAAEAQPDDCKAQSILMQCRYCLRHEMGYCVKRGGKKPWWREPLSLRLADGRTFPLEFDCKHCQMNVLAATRQLLLFCLLFLSTMLTGCYRQTSPTPDGWVPTEEQMDSISFYTTHHYTQNYNFLVTADSLMLIVQQPEEVVSGLYVDTVAVYKNDHLVVADILMLPTDTIDSVWVQVARDQHTIAWSREKDLLLAVSPDNPISRFIDFFSDTHLLIMLAVIVLAGALFTVRLLYRRNAMIVHLRDIGSLYPTLLCLLVAASAVFYSTIQVEGPETWRHFYYHPTLNPFAVPLHLELFLFSVWAILIVGVAAVYDVFRQLPTTQALLYNAALAAVCSVCYIVFSVTTLWHYLISYPLFALYAAFAFWRYLHYARTPFACGNCGQPLHTKGRCPRCGAENI